MSGAQSTTAFETFLASLKDESDETSFIELDREGELDYLNQHRYRFEAIIEILESRTPPGALLDVGTTPFTMYLKGAYPAAEINTIDLTDLLESRCERNSIGFFKCDLTRSPLPFPDGRFDVVLFTEVLEHLVSPPSVVLPELRRVLRSGGSLIVSVPNLATLARRVRFLLGRSPLEGAESQLKTDWVHGRGHVHEYTRREIALVLESFGFAIERVRTLEPPLAQTIRRLTDPWPRRLIQYACSAVSTWCPSFRRTIMIECRAPDTV